MSATIGEERSAWEQYALERERSQARLIIVLTTVLVPAWIPFDYVLEPGLADGFLAYRLLDVAVGVVLFAALRRSRSLRAVEAIAVTKIVSTGSIIGLMLPAVGDSYWGYLFGFSLLFWGTAVIVSLPWLIVGGAFAVVGAVAAASMALIPGGRGFGELLAGGFFILSTFVICLAQIALRRRLEQRAFLSSHRLAEANRKLQRSEAQKNLFFANVSHELRTPLTLILGPAEKLIASAGLNEESRRDLEVVVRSARLLLGRVNELLDATRLELGQHTLTYRRADVGQLTRAIASNFDGLARQRDITLTVDVTEPMVAEMDPDKFQAVLLNLLSNAFKATPQGGSVHCRLHDVAPDRIVLEIADSGSGIPPAQRQAVFERFRRLEDGSGLAGTGLGLSIARDFVQLHRGHITVTDAPGGGACFRVDLPRRAPPSAKVAEAQEHDSVSSADLTWAVSDVAANDAVQESDGRRGDEPLVLVVEDNPELNRFARECLSPEYATAGALDGRSGLDMAHELRPDLVITDLMMPTMDGAALIAALRARPELAHIPVLVLSAREDDELRVRLLREGARDYVTKPFSASELRARAANLVEVGRARALLQAELDTREQRLESLARDITQQRRQLETALESARVAKDVAEHASELKTNFLRMVSHELRSPLGSLALQIQRLEIDAEALPDTSATLVRRMSDSVDRLRDLIETLLEYARIEGGKLTTRIEDFDLVALCQDVLGEVAQQADSKGLSVELQLARGPTPPLHSDPRLVRLIVVNLVSNAIKFTRHGGVTVGLSHETGAHALVVHDTGPGIPIEEQERVFEPFEQLAPIRSKHVAGVGLGLAIVRELVRALGGHIEVESSAQEGTAFRVRLPPAHEVPHEAAAP